jgi:protein phosphatase
MSTLEIPDPALVVMVGVSGAGKTTFCARHFAPEEVVSSDRARGVVSGDENDQRATVAAFDLVRAQTAARLAHGRLAVVDATNLRAEHRRPFVAMARAHDLPAVAIVLNVSEALARQRNRARPERHVTPYVIGQQRSALRRSMNRIEAEGFTPMFVLHSAEAIAEADVVRVPFRHDRSGHPLGRGSGEPHGE